MATKAVTSPCGCNLKSTKLLKAIRPMATAVIDGTCLADSGTRILRFRQALYGLTTDTG